MRTVKFPKYSRGVFCLERTLQSLIKSCHYVGAQMLHGICKKSCLNSCVNITFSIPELPFFLLKSIIIIVIIMSFSSSDQSKSETDHLWLDHLNVDA